MNTKRAGFTEASSHVNFESLWQSFLPVEKKKQQQPPPKPRFLAEKRESRIDKDPRSLPNVIDRIKSSKSLRKRPGSPAVLPSRPKLLGRREEIAAELGRVFSAYTFAEAKEVIAACNDLEEQIILSNFFKNRHWYKTRLGKELAPKIPKK